MLFLIISSIIAIKLFYPIYVSDEIIIPYGIHPFDICSRNPTLWKYIKITFIISFLIANNVFSNFIYIRILSKFKFFKPLSKNLNTKNIIKYDNSSNSLSLLIGKNNDNKNVYVPKSGLYQNFLITRNNRFR